MAISLSHRFSFVILMFVALALSACGLSTSGEPDIVSQREVQLPTRPPTLPATEAPSEPAADPTDVSAEPTADAAAADAARDGSATDTAPDVGASETEGTPPDRTLGRQIFIVTCANCHSGEDGATGPSLFGMSDVAGSRVEGLSAEEYLYQSIVDPSAYVVDGYNDIMPGDYADQFTEHEINSLVEFIMIAERPAPLNEDGTGTIDEPGASDGQGSSDQPPTAVAQGTLTVSGNLIPGTAGADPIGADLPLELYVVDPHATSDMIVETYETTSREGGTFVFEDVVRSPGFIYLLRMDYQGVLQGMQYPPIEGTEDEITLDVTVYERTTDPSSVAITWAQVLVNYAPIEQFGLEVRVDLEIVNTGDRIVTTDLENEQGWPIGVEFELPAGAFGIQPIQSEGSARYQVEVVDGVPVVRDSWPLRPQQNHNITVLYYLPYEDGAVLDHVFGLPVIDGQVLLPNDTVDFVSEQFEDEGEFRYRVMEGGLRVTELSSDAEVDENDVTLMAAHQLLEPLEAGEDMIFTLEGRPTRTINVLGAGAQSNATASDDDAIKPLPVVLAVVGLASLALAGVLWWRQRRTMTMADGEDDAWDAPTLNATQDDLLAAVADLDEAYEAGEIDEETYTERRAILRDRLLAVMDSDATDDE